MSTATIAPIKKITTRDEFLAVCDEVAVHKINYASIVAERDEKIQEVLDTYDHTITATMDTIKRRQKLAEAWAKANRKEILEQDAKSGLSPLSIYAFRTGQPTIKPKGRLKLQDIVKDLIAVASLAAAMIKLDLYAFSYALH